MEGAVSQVELKQPRKLLRFSRGKLAIGLSIMLAIWLLGCAGIYATMLQPPETFARAISKLPGPVPFLIFPFQTLWTRARSGALQLGDAAPDFSLLKVDKSRTISLSGLNQTQPVVLVFGSYT